jgi:hypothetical protein
VGFFILNIAIVSKIIDIGMPMGFKEASNPQKKPKIIKFFFRSRSNKYTIAKFNELKKTDSVRIVLENVV